MYEYQTPDGYGDTFFIYNVNGEDIPLVNGNSYTLVGIPVQDGMFVCRVWSGGILLVDGTTGTVQMYDGVRAAWFQLPVLQGNFPPSLAVLPEKVYRDNTALRFDLTDVALKVNTNGTASVYADQMAWYGSKRVEGGGSDPLKSTYKYYEKPFAYPVPISLINYGPSDGIGNPISGLAAPIQYQQLISDYDFELRRISIGQVGSFGSVAFSSEGSGEIQFTGTAGVTITLSDANIGIPNTVMTVNVVGTVVTINDGTDNTGTLTGTVASAVALFNSTAAAAALANASSISAGVLGGFGTNVIPAGGSGGLLTYDSPFKIMLYDATWRQRMSIPILSELLCHSASTVQPPNATPMPNNSWPCPPLMYSVNSVIRFDIFSLIPNGDALPVNMTLLFEGVRRINC